MASDQLGHAVIVTGVVDHLLQNFLFRAAAGLPIAIVVPGVGTTKRMDCVVISVHRDPHSPWFVSSGRTESGLSAGRLLVVAESLARCEAAVI